MKKPSRVRIIAGTAKGRHLDLHPGTGVRPTMGRVREALFSIIGPGIEGARFLDLYAGSGANGIEALSRGAAFAQFIDNDSEVIDCIARNLDRTGLSARAAVTRANLPDALARADAMGAYDLIFADPPYAIDAYALTISGVAQTGALKPCGWLIVEHSSKRDVSALAAAPLVYIRTARYGETALTIFEHNPPGIPSSS